MQNEETTINKKVNNSHKKFNINWNLELHKQKFPIRKNTRLQHEVFSQNSKKKIVR